MWSSPEPLKISLGFRSNGRRYSAVDVLRRVREGVMWHGPAWLRPARKHWFVDLAKFRQSREFETFPSECRIAMQWMNGVVAIEPEIADQELVSKNPGIASTHAISIDLILDPDEFYRMQLATDPVEITQSLTDFRKAYPDPTSVAFLMMKFGETEAHNRFVAAIRTAFSAHGITVLRADDRQFHDDLFLNVQTYMHGCGLGVAVFERIQGDEFNPNASLEVGYMMSMQKPLCLLKDQSLRTLPTDLVSRLYKPFDVHNPEGTISGHVDRWIRDKGLRQTASAPAGTSIDFDFSAEVDELTDPGFVRFQPIDPDDARTKATPSNEP